MRRFFILVLLLFFITPVFCQQPTEEDEEPDLAIYPDSVRIKSNLILKTVPVLVTPPSEMLSPGEDGSVSRYPYYVNPIGFSTIIDTSALVDSTWLLGYSTGFVIDTIIFKISGVNNSVTATPKIFFGTNDTLAGTPVIGNPSPVTARGIVTKVYSFDQSYISAGNTLWMKFTGNVNFRRFFVQIQGHRQ